MNEIKFYSKIGYEFHIISMHFYIQRKKEREKYHQNANILPYNC